MTIKGNFYPDIIKVYTRKYLVLKIKFKIPDKMFSTRIIAYLFDDYDSKYKIEKTNEKFQQECIDALSDIKKLKLEAKWEIENYMDDLNRKACSNEVKRLLSKELKEKLRMMKNEKYEIVLDYEPKKGEIKC